MKISSPDNFVLILNAQCKSQARSSIREYKYKPYVLHIDIFRTFSQNGSAKLFLQRRATFVASDEGSLCQGSKVVIENGKTFSDPHSGCYHLKCRGSVGTRLDPKKSNPDLRTSVLSRVPQLRDTNISVSGIRRSARAAAASLY